MGVFPHPGLPGYSLLDSGNGEKLERFGDFVLRRPDPQAIWRPALEPAEWEGADYRFVRESDRGGRWDTRESGLPGAWDLPVLGATMQIRPTPFKHVGLFPEQATNWKWVADQKAGFPAGGTWPENGPPRMLNLFGYSGAATLLAAQDGWQVTHVDASRASMDWAADNARRSNLPEDAIRWIFDDAGKFAARELRRGRRYQGIVLDPPQYGRGPRGEKWEFDKSIGPLLETCAGLLDPDGPSFLVLSAYAVSFSPLALANLLDGLGDGQTEAGELALPEEGSGRLLPCGYCARLVRG